ncbi:MAG: FKBP-type peptidyl-prolyl cis-trans isomerase [Bacteroidales bacterium]|nr:FKBP-type peptidyl-prolyl cis-trans isomerase [Bacteroidales bacterium]
MRKILFVAAALLMTASILTSCGRGGKLKGFKRTESGLNYKFHIKTDSPRAQLDDIIIAEIWMYLGEELEYTNAGSPEPMFQVMEPQHPGDLMEALQMIGTGDSVTFAFNLNEMRKYDPTVPEEDATHVFYTIKVHGIYTLEEFQAKMEADQIAGELEEAARLQAYISEKGITVKPNADGVYVIIKTRGTGAVAAQGKTISLNYTGSLLDGTVFDTSFETIAKENDIPRFSFEPLEFLVGAGRMIPGLDNAVVGMRVGTKATLIIPSNMAYGSRPHGPIPAFSPLVFDIEIVGVK